MRPQEVRERLRERGFYVGVVARTEHHYEKLDLAYFARLGVDDAWFLPE